MRNWLRTKLRSWLAVDQCVTQEDSKSLVKQLDGLTRSITREAKNREALEHHVGPPYLPEPRGCRTVYMELEHLRNRLAKLEPKPKVARAKKGR